MKKHRFLLILMVFAGVATALTSCDSNPVPIGPTELTFDGVTYEALGQARLEVTNNSLVVANIGSSGNDGVRVDPDSSIEEADIRTQPVILPENGRWGMEVFGETSSGRTALATVWNEAVSAEEHDLQFDFAPELGVVDMDVEFFLEGMLVHSVRIPVDGGGNRSRVATAGRGRGGPTSVHVICVNGELIVATDHGGEPPRTTQGGCGAELFTNVPGSLEVPICADFVRARPISEFAFPDANSLEITGRSISQFVITSGSVQQP